MSNAKRDPNYITVSMGVNSSDGVTPLMVRMDPVTGYLLVNNSTDFLTPTALAKSKIDQNNISTIYGVSSADNKTLIPIRTSSAGTLLVQFT